MQRWQYFVKRLLWIPPTFLGITVVCFFLTQILPGGPVEQKLSAIRGGQMSEGGSMANARGAAGVDDTITKELEDDLKKAYGFDKPIYQRYWNWLVVDKLGLTMKSYKYTDITVWERIAGRFRVSLIFGITGFLLSYLVCIPLGIAKALRDGGPFDVASSVVVFIGYAIPPFAFGMLLKMFLCGTVEGFWDLFPVAGFMSDNWDKLGFWARSWDIAWHMVLPLLCYMIGSFALLTTLMKNSLLEEIGKDYIRTVLAKGGSHHRAIWGHALRNALIPLATGIGGVLTIMFAGSVLIESVFEIPGMGQLSLEAMVSRDYPVFMGIVAITTVLGLLGNLLRDFCYVLIDPRINFERE